MAEDGKPVQERGREKPLMTERLHQFFPMLGSEMEHSSIVVPQELEAVLGPDLRLKNMAKLPPLTQKSEEVSPRLVLEEEEPIVPSPGEALWRAQ